MEYSAPAAVSVGPFAKLMSASGVLRNEDSIAPLNTIYSGHGFIVGAASAFSHVQIFNPVGSGITMIVDMTISGVVNRRDFHIRRFDTELTTDLGTWVTRSGSGAAGLSHIRTQTNATLLGTLLFTVHMFAAGQAVMPYIYPFELAEGEGILTVTPTAFHDGSTTFIGREI